MAYTIMIDEAQRVLIAAALRAYLPMLPAGQPGVEFLQEMFDDLPNQEAECQAVGNRAGETVHGFCL